MQWTPHGKRRWQVQIQQLPLTPATNDFNEPSFGLWNVVVTTWAFIRPVSGREVFWAKEISADVTHAVNILYWPGLTAKMRVFFPDRQSGKNRIFNILAILDLEERHRELDLLCKEPIAGA